MITYIDLIIAMNRVLGWREGIPLGLFERELSETLTYSVPKFDGTVDSAIQCLTAAGYQFESGVQL